MGTRIKDLLGKSLEGFTLQELTEVFRIDDDGRKSESIGFFRDENLARAFAGNQVDANWYRTEKRIILTDGKTGFLMGEVVILVEDEKVAVEIKKKILIKLSREERKLLKI